MWRLFNMDQNDLVRSSGPGECPKHGHFIGYQVSIPGLDYMMKPLCPVCVSLNAEQKAASDFAEKQSKAMRAIFDSGIPKRFRECSFGGFIPRIAKDQLRLDKLVEYAMNFDPNTSKNLFLFGGIGLGKTHLACALATTLIISGFSVEYANMVSILREQKETMRVGGMTNSEFVNKYGRCHLLILDEFGISQLSAHEQTTMHVILNKRYENMLPTMIVGNLKADTLVALIGDRAARRVESSATKIMLGDA